MASQHFRLPRPPGRQPCGSWPNQVFRAMYGRSLSRLCGGFLRCRENNHPKPGTTSVLVGITSRHSGISGERPQAAVSDVGDPTERHAPKRLVAWRAFRRCSVPGPDVGYVNSTSPDSIDVTSCTPYFANTAGSIFDSDTTPDPRFL